MHLKSFVKRNLAEGILVFAGVLLLALQFGVTKYFLSDGGEDHTSIIGASLDDTYIHCRFAENHTTLHEYSFNPGQSVSADTSPLWVVLISLGKVLTNQLDLVAIILSAIFYLLLAPAVFRICRYTFMLSSWWSVTAGAATLLSSRLVWAASSGMEVTLACFLTLLILHEHIEQRQSGGQMRIREGVMLAFGIAARPELLLLAFICLLDWFYVILKEKKGFMSLVKGKLVMVACVLPVFLIPYFERGSLFYHSSVVQGAKISMLPNISYLLFVLKVLAGNFSIPVALAFVSLIVLKKKHDVALLMVFGFGLPITLSFVAPQFRHHGRYFFEVIPVLTILGIITASKLIRNERGTRRVVYFQMLFIACGMIGAIRGELLAAESVSNINDQHLAAVAWIEQNLPTSEKLAIDDVGAIGYFTKRPVIDLTGLVTPELFGLQHDQRAVWNASRKMGATTYIIYTRLNPAFYEFAKDSLELVKEFRVRPPLVASADTVMSVFRVKGDIRASR